MLNHSVKLKKGEIILLSGGVEAKPLLLELYKQALLKGAHPKIEIIEAGFTPLFYRYASSHHLRHYPKILEYEYKNTDAFIFVAAPRNKKEREELASVDPKKIMLRHKVLEPIDRIRLSKKWLIFRYPTKAYSQAAKMSLKKYTDLVFGASLIDWKSIEAKLSRVKKILERGKKIRILTPDTDLSFGVKGRKWIMKNGIYNLPDGEIFTAPEEKTTEGYIYFDVPNRFISKKISGLYLEFKNGKVVKAKAKTNQKDIDALLNTDKGARYVGEFAFGINPKLTRYMDNYLLDEKLDKTIHLALGLAYKECNGKNKSAIHMDFIKNMRKGKIFIDDKLIYKNGKFVV